jgi:hypothetical protein
MGRRGPSTISRPSRFHSFIGGLDELRQRSPAFAALVADRETLFELIDDAIRLAYKDASGFHFTKVKGVADE